METNRGKSFFSKKKKLISVLVDFRELTGLSLSWSPCTKRSIVAQGC